MKLKLRWQRIGLIAACVVIVLGLFVTWSPVHQWWIATHTHPRAATAQQQIEIITAALHGWEGSRGERARTSEFLVEGQTVWPHCAHKFRYPLTSPLGFTCKTLKHWLLADHPSVITAQMKHELVRANWVAITLPSTFRIPGFNVIAALPDQPATMDPSSWWQQEVASHHADAQAVFAFSRAVLSADGSRAAVIRTRSMDGCGQYCFGALLLLLRQKNHWTVVSDRPFWFSAPPPF